MRVRVVGVADVESLLQRLPVRTKARQKALLWEALREVRTPMRREIRQNVRSRRQRRRARRSGNRRRGGGSSANFSRSGRRRSLRSSIRIQIGTRRRPVFVVRGKTYLVPWNARTQGVSKVLAGLPATVITLTHRRYRDWLRRNTRNAYTR